MLAKFWFVIAELVTPPLGRFISHNIKRHMLADLLQKWDIGQIDTIEPTPEGLGKNWFVRTIAANEYVLKETDLAKAERECQYRLALSQAEFPVAVPIMTIDQNWFVKTTKENVCFLAPRLPGNIISEHYVGNACQRARNFGRAIGLLHVRFSEIDMVNTSRKMDLLGQIQTWAFPTIKRHEQLIEISSVESVWQEAEIGLTALCQNSSLQLIHRDAHPSNMLFQTGQLTGFLDFELVAQGLRLFDICYCGSSILVSGIEDPQKAAQWPAIFRSLVQGYQEHNSLMVLELNCVYEMMIAIELIFMAFWLDYGNLEEAEKVKHLVGWLKQHQKVLKF